MEYDHIQAKDTLLRIMEMETLSEKEKRAYQTVVKSINRIIKEDREYTPDLKELERMKDQYLYQSFRQKYTYMVFYHILKKYQLQFWEK